MQSITRRRYLLEVVAVTAVLHILAACKAELTTIGTQLPEFLAKSQLEPFLPPLTNCELGSVVDIAEATRYLPELRATPSGVGLTEPPIEYHAVTHTWAGCRG